MIGRVFFLSVQKLTFDKPLLMTLKLELTYSINLKPKTEGENLKATNSTTQF